VYRLRNRTFSDTPIHVAKVCSSAVCEMNKIGPSTDPCGTEHADLKVEDDEARDMEDMKSPVGETRSKPLQRPTDDTEIVLKTLE
jgi:hypothetical protein